MATRPENLTINRDRKGVVVWTFTRNGVLHHVKAAACVTKLWGEPDSPEWIAARNAFGVTMAQLRCDTLDAGEAFDARFLAATEKMEAVLVAELRQRMDAISAYLKSHPAVSAETVGNVLRPRAVTVLKAVKALTEGL